MLFFLLGLTVFPLVLVRPISCVSFCFCCASFVSVMLIGITSVFDLLVGLFFRLLAFFWLVCWCLFLVCCFLAVVRLDKYRRPDPCEHYHAFFTCSPIVYLSTASIPTIYGHRCTSGLVCVSVASVHVCLWSCAHIVRSCAYVFADVFGAYMCVLGVFPVSMHP